MDGNNDISMKRLNDAQRRDLEGGRERGRRRPISVHLSSSTRHLVLYLSIFSSSSLPLTSERGRENEGRRRGREEKAMRKRRREGKERRKEESERGRNGKF